MQSNTRVRVFTLLTMSKALKKTEVKHGSLYYKTRSNFFKEDAEELLLPTSTGYIGILQEHAPLVTGLDNGVLALRQGTSWKILALLGGFGVIKENRVNILCRDIEDAADIDVDEAERRVVEARTGMEKAESRKIYIENQLTFDRERARIEAHKMWKNSAGGTPVFGG